MRKKANRVALVPILLLACTDQRSAFEANEDDVIAIYETAVRFTAIEPTNFDRVVISGRFLDLNDPYRSEPTGDTAILWQLAQRFPVARVCSDDAMSEDCTVGEDETWLAVSTLSRPTPGVAEVHVVRYVNERTGDGMKMRLEKRGEGWEVIDHVVTMVD
jgi:hypothetical protein